MEISANTKRLAGSLRDFTCLQDIQRTTPLHDGRLVSDFLRLEVGVVNGKEACGWPGGTLEATSPAELTSFGVSGTGDFFAHLKSLVADREGRVVSVQRIDDDRWAFEISVGQLESSFSFGSPAGKALVAYQARVLVDVRERQVRQIGIRVPEVPLGLRTKAAVFDLTYDSASAFPAIPARSTGRISTWTEPDVILESRWHECSSFSVESRLVESDETVSKAAAIPSQWVAVDSPRIHTRLQSAIALESTGTEVPLVLTQPVRLATGAMLPSGTVISARLAGITSLAGFPGRLAALRLEAYTAPSIRIAFRARSVSVEGPQARRDLRRSAQTVLTGRIDRSTGIRTSETQLLILGNQDDALILLEEGETMLRPPLQLIWETIRKAP